FYLSRCNIKAYKTNYYLIIYIMEDRLEKLNEIKEENFIWIIYIGIIILSYYANSKEVNYLLFNDEKSRQDYQNIMILIFTILVIIYYHFTKQSYNNFKNLNIIDSEKKKILTYASFIGALLVLISGIIFLSIVVLDENIDVEIAFN
ncbi:MAG: hypothetical protein ACI4VL_01685, partial [Bacilli bacterium]